MSDLINVQVQETGSKTWQTYGSVLNQPIYITSKMQELARRHPDKRVRAVDSSGRVVDIL